MTEYTKGSEPIDKDPAGTGKGYDVVTTEATMEKGNKVEYNKTNGSYPEGTSPGLGKDYSK